jgi:hypothetical protein
MGKNKKMKISTSTSYTKKYKNCITPKYSTKQLTKVEDIMKGNQFDCHSWVEYDDGTIDDYDDISLSKISMLGNLDIVRTPFPLELTIELLPYVKKNINRLLEIFEKMDREEQEQFLDKVMNQPGGCIYRSYFIKAALIKQGKKCKIVYGSLGFKQSNGTIFYEYG